MSAHNQLAILTNGLKTLFEHSPSMLLLRPDCPFCSVVWRVFTDCTYAGVEKSGIVDRPCHHQLLQYIRENFNNPRSRLRLKFSLDAVVMYDIRTSRKYMRLVDPPNPDLARLEATGRVLDKDWVDLNLLQKWKRGCLNFHYSCRNHFDIPHVSPAWLIDTFNDCLVPGERIQGFVILSYVWGTASCLRNERAIVHELQEPGVLSRLSSTLSTTIRHAMGLTREMGERYLWADALCIVQDDVEQTRDQLMLMGKLYASATFTIVATDEDGNGGIPGIRGTSHPRDLNQVVLPLFSSEQKVTIQDESLNHSRNSNTPNYFNRGWTFQEYVLSKRRLIVGKKQFHWICPSAAFFESTVSVRKWDNDLYEDQYLSDAYNTLSRKSFLEQLCRVISDYNGRNHSFPEDALAGVTGILEILRRSFEGGFIYGMPVMYFHAALMWKSSEPFYTERRHHSGRDHSVLQGSCLPSWSWLGWKDAKIRIPENDGTFQDSRDATIGIVQWCSHESPTRSNMRPVGPSFPSTILDDTLSRGLAQGWKIEKYEPDHGYVLSPLRSAIRFKHLSMPYRVFWGWFPIKEDQGNLCPASPPQHPFISCEARRGWFNAQQDPRVYHSTDSKHPTATVYNMDGNHCGWLQIMTQQEATKLPAADSGQYHQVELVAICLRKNIATDDKYGVLCVEWVDGVAYRKGVGEIEKEAWESHDLEDVDLILG